MTLEASPPTRRKFADAWDEIQYLYQKLLYWFYERGDPPRARRFSSRLRHLLKKADPHHESILGEECRSLLSELKDDLRSAIRHRENEIRLIERVHEKTLGTPSQDYILSRYDYSDLSDRLDLLATLYHDAGDFDRAVEILQDSERLCRSHGIAFDGQDLLDDYRAEQRRAKVHPGPRPRTQGHRLANGVAGG
jgi:hypothetical protein